MNTRPGRRGHRIAAAAAAGALLLTGCGLGSGDSDSSGQPAALNGGMTGTITFQTLQLKPTFTTYIDSVIKAYEQAHPDVKVNWVDIPFEGAQEKLTTDATSGSLPDVVNLNPNFAQPLEKKGLFLDLNTAASGLESQYVGGAWTAFQVPGKQESYGFPWYLTSEVTMYNADLFREAGLDPAAPPKSFDELWTQADKIAKAGKGKYYALHPALENKFITDLAKLGVPLMNAEGTKFTFNTPDAAKYVDKLKELYDSGAMPKDSITQDHAKEIEAYQAGKIALFPSGPNFLTIVEENAPQIAKATRVAPQITGPKGVANMSVMGLLVPKASKNQTLAVDFAKFMTNAENQLAFAKIVTILPSTSSSLQDKYFTDDTDGSAESKARKISAAQIGQAQNLVPVQYDDRVKKVVIGKIELALQGKVSAADALDQAVEGANGILSAG